MTVPSGYGSGPYGSGPYGDVGDTGIPVHSLTDELRRRLDVPIDLVSDDILLHFLTVAAHGIDPYLVPDGWTLYPDNVDEASLQLSVKQWDVSTRGAVSMDALGDWIAPTASATPGMIRTVFGTLGPALARGGVTV